MKTYWKKSNKTQEPESPEKAYEYAVFLLSLQLRTVGQVLTKMSQRGFSQKVIETTLERLKNQKYLDDKRYAEMYLQNLKTYRNFGYYGIKKKMLEKKIASTLIDEVLATGLPVSEEKKIAERFIKKTGFTVPSRQSNEAVSVEYRVFGDQEDNIEKGKLVNKLQSRGFRQEVIGKLLY